MTSPAAQNLGVNLRRPCRGRHAWGNGEHFLFAARHAVNDNTFQMAAPDQAQLFQRGV